MVGQELKLAKISNVSRNDTSFFRASINPTFPTENRFLKSSVHFILFLFLQTKSDDVAQIIVLFAARPYKLLALTWIICYTIYRMMKAHLWPILGL